jgi:plasmid stabilization system protein ParE
MKRYTLVISEKAQADIHAFYNCILYEYKQSQTARRNRIGLYTEIRRLSSYAGSIAVSRSAYIQALYGPGARRVNYGKMAIIYLIEGDYVYIKRVMAASLIR